MFVTVTLSTLLTIFLYNLKKLFHYFRRGAALYVTFIVVSINEYEVATLTFDGYFNASV